VKGGGTVKKLSLLLALLLVTGSLTTTAFAITQDHSFTYTSTAGMFEDTYDFFKASPAYLPSFQKNVFWGQLSNLENSSDYQINNGSNGSNYYLLGGQMDLMGAGRGGFMLDWHGTTSSNSVTDFTGNNGSGLSEHTNVAYTTSDGFTIDGRSEKYGRAKQVDNQADYDVYAAYGLGNIAGFDFGAAVRGSWWDSNPTYDPFSGAGTNDLGYTFDGSAYARTYNVVTGALTNTYDRSQTGSLDYSSSNWRVILGGRAKNLLPNLDLVVNIAPIMNTITNKFTADYSENYDFQPGGPLSTQSTTAHSSGAEINATADYGLTNGHTVPMYPGSGVGVLANVRGDYTLTPSVTLTGEAGFSTQPMTISDDAKLDYNIDYSTRAQTGTSLLAWDNAYSKSDKFSGTVSNSLTYVKLRSQLASGKNWKLGAGINYAYSFYKNDVKEKYSGQRVYTQSGDATLHNNYVETVTDEGFKAEDVTEYDDSIVELPLGLVFNFLDTLPVRFGVIHTIDYSVTTKTHNVSARTPSTNTTVYADGVVNSQVSDTTQNSDESNTSTYGITHSNTFFYGASWWPYNNVQIDFTGFATNVLALTNYKLSFNLYF